MACLAVELPRTTFLLSFLRSKHHVPCYFRKKNSGIKDGVADIEGFMDIKYDDQKLIKDLMSGAAAVEPAVVKPKGKGKIASGELDVGNYAVEVAKSGRSKCRKCEQYANIEKILHSSRQVWQGGNL